MRSGLHKQLLFLAIFPALLVALALATGIGWQGVSSARHAARRTAHLQADNLALKLYHTADGKLALPEGSLDRQGLSEARIVDASGHILIWEDHTQKPLAAHGYVNHVLSRVGRLFIHPGDLLANAPIPGMPGMHMVVELQQQPWWIAAGRDIMLAAVAVLAGILLALLAGIMVGTRLTMRLRTIARQITRLTHGDHNYRLQVSGDGEISRLARDLNRLTDILARRTDGSEDAEDEETQNPKGSKALRKSFDSYLQALDHELRSPLNAINGYAQLLGREPLTRSQQENLAVVRSAVNTMTFLLDDMLQEPKGKKKSPKRRQRTFDLVVLIDEVIHLAAPGAYAKGVDIIADCGGWRSLPVTGDELHIRQILTNLVGNGVKYTPQGHVCLQLAVGSTRGDKLEVVIHVNDTGPGIPARHRARVFQPHERLKATSGLPGKGLGLALSQRLAEDMGGHISLAEAAGGGCRFSLHLALAHAESFVASPAPPSAPMMLWESNPIIRNALAHRLGAAGGELEFATSRDALLQYLKTHPDTIGVLGLKPYENLPDKSEALPQLRVLTCTLEPPQQGGLTVAPKCIGQQRLEDFLDLHTRRKSNPAQSYLSPRLWRILCEDMPVDLDRLANALRNEDMEDARAAVHRICGTTSFVRMHESETAARELEKTLKEPDTTPTKAWKQLKSLSHTILGELRRIAPPVTQRSLASWRIMVVDDNRLNAELLARHLESHGAIVDQFFNATEARSAPGPWHAILVDVQLEDENGIQLGQELRQKFSRTLLIAQSGDMQVSTRTYANESGFHDYLTKPIDLDQLPHRLIALRASANQ
ncbi:MAG TPA: ATP-binding protein [Gammaproteobacteria bacterium]|nr:ATP-binding protein [Gammaproteobacteria bacterium]